MLGERYLATREKLLGSFDSVAALAAETGFEIAPHWNTTTLRDVLERPFLLTVCGEINAGKSSLINAITGQYLCPVSALPETDRPTLHSYAPQRKDTNHAEKWRQCAWPIDSLKLIHWLDLPGIDAVGKTAVQEWMTWLQTSDVLLVVFPFRNPFGAPTWDFLARLPESVLTRVVFILQQCDEGQSADVPVMLGHLNELSQKRLGFSPPAFAVSARMGFEAKTKSSSSALLHRSGLPAIEGWLENRIHHCEERRQALESMRRAALGILLEIEEKLDRVNRTVQQDVRFLESIEREIFALHQKTLHRHMQGLGAIAEVFSLQADGMAKLLQSRLGILLSMGRVIRGEDTAQRLEALLQERLTSAMKAAAACDMADLIGECEAHWQTVAGRIREQTDSLPAAWSDIVSPLQESRQYFVERMGRVVSLNVGQLRVRGALDHSLRKRNSSLSAWMGLCSVLLITAGVTGGLAIGWVPQIFVGLAFFVLVLLVLFCVSSAREIVSEYRSRLLLSADVFIAALRGDYEEGLSLFFRQYAQSLESVRKALAQRGSSFHPLMQRWNERFLEIKAIEQEMAD